MEKEMPVDYNKDVFNIFEEENNYHYYHFQGKH